MIFCIVSLGHIYFVEIRMDLPRMALNMSAQDWIC